MQMLELIMLEAVLTRNSIKLIRVLKTSRQSLRLILTTLMQHMLEVLVKIREEISLRLLMTIIWH
jgi:hypothetical protein